MVHHKRTAQGLPLQSFDDNIHGQPIRTGEISHAQQE